MVLANKIALVTGAARGIGRAITLELAEKGATVIGADINQQMADEISQYISDAGFKGTGVVMDVTSADSVNAAIENICQKFSAPSILVNNAGITRDNLVLRMKDDEWNAVIDTNLSSIFRVSQACIKGMVRSRWGRIINIASVVGFSGNAGQANYSAAKAGLIAFSKSLALEVASRNITVNAIAPGFIDTKMTQQLNDEQKEVLLKMIPMHRVGQPEEVAHAVTFLASDEAAYMTGCTLHVNGGMVMY